MISVKDLRAILLCGVILGITGATAMNPAVRR